MAPTTTTSDLLSNLARAGAKLTTTSLPMKIHQLRQSKSADPVQQLQTEAIVDLYDAVKQIQEALWPLLQLIPDTSSVRDAAAKAGASTVTRNSVVATKLW